MSVTVAISPPPSPLPFCSSSFCFSIAFPAALVADFAATGVASQGGNRSAYPALHFGTNETQSNF